MKQQIATKKGIIECDACGGILRSGNPKIKDCSYWENTDGKLMCNDCMAVPLNVLEDVYVFLKKNKLMKPFREQRSLMRRSKGVF